MRTEAEGDVLAGVAEDVEAVGVGELRGIAVGGAEADAHHRPLGDLHAADLDVGDGAAHDEQERRLVADALLDGLRKEGPVVVDGIELVGVGEEAEEQIAARPIGRLRARRQEQAQEGENLLVGELMAVDLGADQVADEVVLGLPPAQVDNALEVVAQAA